MMVGYYDGEVRAAWGRETSRGVLLAGWFSLAVFPGAAEVCVGRSHSGEAAARKALAAYRRGADRIRIVDPDGIVSLAGGRTGV